MADKVKNISINAMDKIAKENYRRTIIKDWNGHELVVKRLLPLNGVLEFARKVAASCFAQDTNEYLPEVRDFAIRSTVVEMYANINLPDNLEHQYELLYMTDIFDVVFAEIDKTQFNALVDAIDDKIAITAEANIQMLQSKIDDAAHSVSAIVEQVSSMFDGISNDDIKKLVDAVGQNGIDEEKIIRLITGNEGAVQDASDS